MKWRKEKAANSQDIEDQKKRDLFRQTVRNVEGLLEDAELDVERTDILNYIISVIGREIAYNVAARPIYDNDNPFDSNYLLPECEESILCEGTYSLENVTVVSKTNNLRKLRCVIPEVFRQGFRQEKRGRMDTEGILYKEINLFVVSEGKHHLSAAMVKNSGSAHMRICSLEKMFSRWKTDGAYWYRGDTKYQPVFDCRMAILYELARMKSVRMLPDAPQEIKPKEVSVPPCGSSYFIFTSYRYYSQLMEAELQIRLAQIDILKNGGVSPEIEARLAEMENTAQSLRREFESWVSDGDKQQKALCTHCSRTE